MSFFLVGHCDFCFWLYLNENKQAVHMRYHLFLHYGWFLQNLEKDFIRTNMHTTVHLGFFVKIRNIGNSHVTPQNSIETYHRPEGRITVVKWVSIIWQFGKKNHATQKIWEFAAPEIFRILVNKPTEWHKNLPFCVRQTLLSSF